MRANDLPRNLEAKLEKRLLEARFGTADEFQREKSELDTLFKNAARGKFE